MNRLPRRPAKGVSYWLNSPNGRNSYTHHFFRFPAKFHPPVVQWALATFGRRGSAVLDPFNGSGTLQVEALLRGINSLGIDIDPLACLIAQVKTTPISANELQDSLAVIQRILAPLVQEHSDIDSLPGADISQEQFEEEAGGLSIPPIPNIFHWFRRYVIIDLARILSAIEDAEFKEPTRRFFRGCAAAIIRHASNADPFPVSGLEVTKMQAEKNTHRTINVFGTFFGKAQREIIRMDMLWAALKSRDEPLAKAHVAKGDVLDIEYLVKKVFPIAQDGFPLVVTSPPYCRAVEYSRRHRLEMFWLDLVTNADDHVRLKHSYIGRPYVRVNEWNMHNKFGIKDLDSTIRQVAERDHHKARTIHHYFHSMSKALHRLKNIMTKRGTMICVLGDSVCCDVPVATSDIVAEIAMEHFQLENRFSYAIRNHHMQYGLWNGEGIKQEHVLVLKPR